MAAAKKIYSYPSAVVHGRGSAGKLESVTLLGSQMNSVDGARVMLRELLRDRLEEPALTNDEIDNRIIVSALDAWATRTPAVEVDQDSEERSGSIAG